MSKINAICVYCGSSPGTDPAFVEAARDFGKILAHSGIRLVWGGGSVGLMGAIASSVIEHGGAATGIQFGRSQVVARLYNKTLETKEKGNDAYAELLTARCGEAFDPQQDVWRLEFELKREGAKVGRNDPCPCGSGKKFKKCHGVTV